MLSGDSRHCWPCYFELLNKTQLREYKISAEGNSKTKKIRWRRRKNKRVPAAVWAQTKGSVTNTTDHSAVMFSAAHTPQRMLIPNCWVVHGPVGCRMAEGLLKLMEH